MEKDDIKEIRKSYPNLFSVFDEYLKNGTNGVTKNYWCKFFYVSLCYNVWYDIENDVVYDFSKDYIVNIAEELSKYVNNNFFDTIGSSEYYYFSQSYEKGYISDYIKEVEEYKKFIVLPKSEKSLAYIKSLSRDNKINKIIK